MPIFSDYGVYRDPEIQKMTLSKANFERFRLWMLNLDVWGSFEPIGPQCYDIQMTRAAAYTKLTQIRKRIRGMIDYWEEQAEESG